MRQSKKITREQRRLEFEAEVLLVNAFFKAKKSGCQKIDHENAKRYPVIVPPEMKWIPRK